MSNVVALKFPVRQTTQMRQAELLACFATHRRGGDDVFWLKENAELLNILQSTDVQLESGALSPFEELYATIEKRVQFFPQYYRFLLAICLDLEDLGMAGNTGERICRWAAQAGLAQAELSDLQRAEARRLMARRGVEALPGDGGLNARLHRFMERSTTFAMPNKKAAYELTHIVFYLSEYGRRDPGLSGRAVTSLEFAGLLAYLDQNIDLLAEICVALRFAGHKPSAIWEDAVVAALADFDIYADGGADMNDGYHEFLVAAWAVQVAGGTGFASALPSGSLRFQRHSDVAPGALRTMSECMFDLDGARSGNWSRMRPLILPHLAADGEGVLAEAEQSTDKFDAFFEGFARAAV